MKVLVVIARMAATESIAKIRSVASIDRSTTNSSVATRLPSRRTKNRSPW